MSAILLALTASLAWGTSDFLGGVAARDTPLPLVLAGSQLAGLLAFAPILLLRGTAMPHDARLLLGLAAGVVAGAPAALLSPPAFAGALGASVPASGTPGEARPPRREALVGAAVAGG